MYPENPRNYPEWIAEAFNDAISGPGVFLDFPTPRIAESARSRMYAFLKAARLAKKFTIRRADARLTVTADATTIPAHITIPTKTQVPEEMRPGLDEVEKQLLKEHGLKLKVHSIGKVDYFGIDTMDGRPVQYHRSAMEAIMWFLNNKPLAASESPSPTTPPNMSATYKEIQDASDDQMRALGYGVSEKEAGK